MEDQPLTPTFIVGVQAVFNGHASIVCDGPLGSLFYSEPAAPRPLDVIEQEGATLRARADELVKLIADAKASLDVLHTEHTRLVAHPQGVNRGRLFDLVAEAQQRARWDADGDQPPVKVVLDPGRYPGRQEVLDLQDPNQVVVDKVTSAYITLRRRGGRGSVYSFRRDTGEITPGGVSETPSYIVDCEGVVEAFQAWSKATKKAEKTKKAKGETTC